MIRLLALFAVTFVVVPPAQAATRLAVLAVESPALADVATLLELELLKLPDTEALERAAISKVLEEQRLSAALAANAPAERVALGRILQADVLVLVLSVEKPEPHGMLVVFETRRGLRLELQPFETTSDPGKGAATLVPRVRVALERARSTIEEIVAVPPFVSTDLALERQSQGKPLATVVEQMLLARPGFAVVELAEAKALADEVALTASDGVARSLPLYLLGEFRHDGYDENARLMISLSLRRGATVVGSATVKDVPADDVAQVLRKEAATLFDGASSGTQRPVDPAAEAEELANRASLMFRLCGWMECVELAEASVLLKSGQPTVHRMIVDAINKKAGHDSSVIYDKACEEAVKKGLPRSHLDLVRQEATEAARKVTAWLARRARPHLEQFMMQTRLRYSDDLYRTIGWFFAGCGGLDPEQPAMMVRVLRAKKASQCVDDTETMLFYCWQSCLRGAPSAEQWRWKLDVAENWPSRDPKRAGGNLLHLVLQGVNRDDAELPAMLARLKTIDNPEVQRVANDILRRLDEGFELHTDRPLAGRRPPVPHRPPQQPQVPDARPDIRLTRRGTVDYSTGNAVEGWIPAGRDTDAVWSHDWLCFVKGETPVRWTDGIRISLGDERQAVCFDRRSVWAYRTTDDGKPELLVVDPATSEVTTLTTAHGLPPMALDAVGFTALRDGSVCVVGHFQGRAWIGRASFDPTTGRRSLGVILEAVENTVAGDRDAWKNPRHAFRRSEVHALTGEPAEDGSVPERVVVQRFGDVHHEPPLLIDPATNQVEVYQHGPLVLGFPVQHDGALYWADHNRQNPGIGRFGFPSLKPETYASPLPSDCRLFRAGRLIYLQRPMGVFGAFPDLATWIADDFDTPFRQLQLELPDGMKAYPRFFSSARFGTIAVGAGNWYSVDFIEPSPAPDPRDDATR